jgi:hypothetical protein
MPFEGDVEPLGWNIGPHLQNVRPPKALDDATRANYHTTTSIMLIPTLGDI